MDATYLKTYDRGLVHYYCDHHMPAGATRISAMAPKSTLKKFFPLMAIFSAVILFTVLVNIIHGWSLELFMRAMMGSFFVIFGLFKIFNLRAFADAYQTYDIIALRSRAYAFAYPFIELALGALYLINIGGIYRDIFTFILMAVSSVGVFIKLREREEVPCACLGMVFKVPMTWVTLVEDLLMAIEALVMLLIGLNIF